MHNSPGQDVVFPITDPSLSWLWSVSKDDLISSQNCVESLPTFPFLQHGVLVLWGPPLH